MKKLLLSIALLSGFSVSALEVKLHQVSYFHETVGNKSLEAKNRKLAIADYKKLGYTFDGMVVNSKGKFMKFIK